MKLNNQISSELQLISQMNVDIETDHSRKTSIIGTIGILLLTHIRQTTKTTNK
jgi:hypothetical protein